MLRYKADLRALAYMVITTTMFVLQWQFGFNWIAYIVYLHFSIAVSVMTHNHNHLSIWTKKWLNLLTDWWLTVFYGLPIFMWIPTHNRNHHRHINGPEDVTRTYRHSDHNDFVSLIQYPSVSGYNQVKESVLPYMRELKAKNPQQFWENIIQLAILISWITVFFVLDWKKALLYVIIPQQVSQLVVIVFNYVQHVHADDGSQYNHSRNFTGVNLFLFNNGYHTVHHHRASMHWSETPAAHKKIEHLIAPELKRGSLWVYIFQTYVFSYFIPKYRSNQMPKTAVKKVVETAETEVIQPLEAN